MNKFNHVRVFAAYLTLELGAYFIYQIANGTAPRSALTSTLFWTIIPTTWFLPFIATTIHEHFWKRAQKRTPQQVSNEAHPPGGRPVD